MKNKEISNLMSRGRAYNSSSFLLRVGVMEGFLDEKPIKKPKNIAFLAPKKVFTTAVLRNKAKRRLKNALQKARQSLKASGMLQNDLFMAKNKLTFAFTAKKQVIDIDFESLYNEIEQILAKI